MTAERLREAADRLDALADRARYHGDRWMVDVSTLADSATRLGPVYDALTATWPQASYIAAMGPRVGKALAAWLLLHAAYSEDPGVRPIDGQSYALAVADAILGGAE